MSSSVFKVYDSSSRDGFASDAGASGTIGAKDGGLSNASTVHEELKLDSNLVIVVNKDGSVSVDQATLQSLLANETNDTSVSVVRISSPTPSIEEEIEEEQRLLKEEKQKLDADADGASSNEDSNEDSSSVAGTSSATSSVAGIPTRRGRLTGSKKSSGTMLLGEEDDPKHVSLTVEAYYPPSEASNFAAQVLSLTGYEHPLRKEAVDIEYLKQLVSNDHCYTPLSSPTQKLPPRTVLDDVDSSEESAITTTNKPKPNASSVGAKFADVRKGIDVKVNKAGPPAAASSTTSTLQSKQRKPATSTGAVASPPSEQKKATKPGKPIAKPVPEEEDEDNDDEDFDSDYSEEESSFSEDDDEMDVDFSVSGRTTNKKRKQAVKTKASPKSLQRVQYRKADAREQNEPAGKEGDKYKHGKVGAKSVNPTTTVKTLQQKATLAKAEQSFKGTPTKKDFSKVCPGSSSSSGSSTPTNVGSKHPLGAVPGKAVAKPDSSQPKTPTTTAVSTTVSATASGTLSVPKKEKKPKTNPHDAALFSDMSALFSTPDIIKKVNAGKATTPTSTSGANSGIAGGPLGTNTGHQSVVTPVKTPILAKPAEKQKQPETPMQVAVAHPLPIELIDAIVQEDLRQSAVPAVPIVKSGSTGQMSQQQPPPPPPQQPAGIPGIVNMLEQTSASAVEPNGSAMLPVPLLPEMKPIQPVVAPMADLLPDTSILEALNSNDDALPEELLEHVAELAKNKELQEILDKQVLGVIGSEGLGLVPPVIPMAPASVTHLLPEQPLVVQEASASTTSTTPSFPTVPTVQNVASDASLSLDSTEPVPQQPATVKEQTVPRKDAIQIRRSDGRVITLPPIEAPATRASKRRAQVSEPSTPTSVRKSIDQSPIVVSVAAGSEITAPETPKLSRRPSIKVASTPASSSSRPMTPAGTVETVSSNDQAEQQPVDEAAKSKRINKPRQSIDNNRAKRVSSTNVAIAIEAAQDDDYESDESWNSEDDPDRLWCICRQPHNNRFMICCDSCEDWFHGKCVNITKAMGQQMEQDGIEWTCPNCLKKKQDRQQPKLMAFWQKANEAGATDPSAPSAKTPQPGGAAASSAAATAVSDAANNCVACSKQAKPSSIYCSDDCIRKHASTTVANATSASRPDKPKDRPNVPSTSVSVAAAVSDLTNDSQIVIVMERKTGRCLTGKNAPRLENLKSWLQAHPTFELVPPTSQQGQIILKKQAEMRKQQLDKEAAEKKASSSVNIVTTTSTGAAASAPSPKVQTQLKFNEQRKMIISASASASTSTTGTKSQSSPKILSTTSSKGQAGQKSSLSSASGASPGLLAKGTGAPGARTVSSSANQQKLHVVVSGINSSTPPTPTTPTMSTSINSKQKKPTQTPSPASDQTKQFRSSKSTTTPAGENIRVTVKKTLKEHLMQRTAELQEESTFKRLTEEEIDRFVEDTEHQMFMLFNKDTGMKYRAKYRSLVFNIKDRKNLSLFQKISEKLIEPKQLVRMTADELASQELAQWREKEAKHQLEMIKKSELDLLACAKNYVLKTHKGEEVIEGKTDERVQLDPSAPVEDVVLLLNNSAVSSTSELDDTSSSFMDGSHRSKDYDYGVYGKSYAGMYGSGSISSSSSAQALGTGKADGQATGGGGGAGSSSSSSRKKESRRSSRSRSRGRKHERDRSRDRSRSKHKRKRSRERSHEGHSSRDRDRDRDRERDRERDRDRERERERDRHHKGRERSKDRSSKHEAKSSRDKEPSAKSSSDKRRTSTASRGMEATDPTPTKDVLESERKVSKTSEAQSKPTTTGSSKKRVDGAKETTKLPPAATETVISDKETEVKDTKIPQVEQASDAAALETQPSTVEKNDDATKPTSIAADVASKDSKPDQDQEPSSTVTIPTPPHYPFDGQPTEEANSGGGVVDPKKAEAEKNHWTGSVHMIDVASIEMSIRAVSGEVHDVAKGFTEDLNICGTIKPEIVWEYIGQIKKSPNKEICLVRFHSTEASAYYTLYNHLHSRKRYSVVKSPSPSIKDFYIFPLPADQMIPMILKPLRGIGIIEGDNKPNLLLGILVKIKGGKRPSSSNAANASTASKIVRHQSRSTVSSAGGKANALTTTPGGTSVSNKPDLVQQVITKYASKESPNEATGVAKPAGSESGLKLDTTASMRVEAKARSESSDTNTPDTPVNDPMDVEVDMNIIKAPIAGKAVSTEGGSSSSSTTVGLGRVPESNSMLLDDDDDEPYSPGGGSDDSNFADVTAIVDTSKVQRSAVTASEHGVDPDEERMRIAMDELNRKIAEQKNEIVGLISMGDFKEEEINSALPPSLINEIPIPPNLSQILASIKGGGAAAAVAGGVTAAESVGELSSGPSSGGMVSAAAPVVVEPMSALINRPSEAQDDEEEYNPTTPALYGSYKAAPSMPYAAIPVANSQGDIDERILPAALLPATVVAPVATFDPLTSQVAVLANLAASLSPVAGVSQPAAATAATSSAGEGESRLAKLTDEELLSMVPDDAILPDSSSKDG
ncbi:death-inducer obliterator 1 [Anopheles stephensi]|uniref:death-inducer obliterator 1 n=1 Tax=Anopheles stephensi TaxID=30069 RepID=UPI001658B6AA|nr:death-inducer obliterator 1 [Anopheles stephensi]